MQRTIKNKIEPLAFYNECILLATVGRGKITAYAIAKLISKAGMKTTNETAQIVAKALTAKGLLLEEVGYVRTKFSSQPKRATLYEITSKGEEALAQTASLRAKLTSTKGYEKLLDVLEADLQ